MKFFNLEIPPKNKSREYIIAEQSAIEELNVLVSYEIAKEGGEGYDVYLQNTPGVMESEELYSDAMKKLAIIVEENKDITKIKMISSAVSESSDLFIRMGFSITKINKLHQLFLGTNSNTNETGLALASIGRDEFLKRFASELVTK